VRDEHDGARIVDQVLLEEEHGIRVEMVGRLVEQQQVGLREQRRAIATRFASPPLRPSTPRSQSWTPRRVSIASARCVQSHPLSRSIVALSSACRCTSAVMIGVRRGERVRDRLVLGERRPAPADPPRRHRGSSGPARTPAPATGSARWCCDGVRRHLNPRPRGPRRCGTAWTCPTRSRR
jgi:hypothetical protein